MPEARLIGQERQMGVKMTVDGRSYRVMFATEGAPGGTIRIAAEDGPNTRVLLSQPLADTVQPQRRYGAEE